MARSPPGGVAWPATSAEQPGGTRERARHGEQFARTGDVAGATAVGEQTVVAHAVEAFGQDVNEEAADELG